MSDRLPECLYLLLILTCDWAVNCNWMADVFNLSASNKCLRPAIFWLDRVTVVFSSWKSSLLVVNCLPNIRFGCDVFVVIVVWDEGVMILLLSVVVVNAFSMSCPSRKRGFSMFSLQAAANAAIVGFGSPLASMSFTKDLISSDSDWLQNYNNIWLDFRTSLYERFILRFNSV